MLQTEKLSCNANNKCLQNKQENATEKFQVLLLECVSKVKCHSKVFLTMKKKVSVES